MREIHVVQLTNNVDELIDRLGDPRGYGVCDASGNTDDHSDDYSHNHAGQGRDCADSIFDLGENLLRAVKPNAANGGYELRVRQRTSISGDIASQKGDDVSAIDDRSTTSAIPGV